MYVDRSLSGDPKKDSLMDEINVNKCMCFKIKTTSKFFVGITVKGRMFIIHLDCFDANKKLACYLYPKTYAFIEV